VKEALTTEKISARKRFGPLFVWLSILQLLFTNALLIVFFVFKRGDVSDTIIGILVTGLFGSVLGLTTIVAKYYFNRD
jgi:hypothetical protein